MDAPAAHRYRISNDLGPGLSIAIYLGGKQISDPLAPGDSRDVYGKSIAISSFNAGKPATGTYDNLD